MKTVEQELESIRIENGGVLRPADVVAFAEDVGTKLHGWFEWDDTAAAAKYRLEQARLVIRVQVFMAEVPGKESIQVRSYVNLRGDRGEDSYRAMVDVLGTPSYREMMLAEAKAELKSVRCKYNTFVELSEVYAAIDRLAS